MSLIPLYDLWSRRSTILYLSLLNVKLRYKGSYLGFFWSALEPLLTFLLLYVVFTNIRTPTQEHFAVYLLTGILLYHIFTRGTMSGLTSLHSNRKILSSINVKKQIFPVSSVGASFLLGFVEMFVLLLLFPVFGFAGSWTVLLLPVPIVLMLGLVLGMSYFLSIINIYLRDVQIIWAVIVHAMFFISPIFWYVDNVDGILLGIHQINPIGQIIDLSHDIVFGTIPPASEWLYSVFFVIGLVFSGYWVFQKMENKVMENV